MTLDEIRALFVDAGWHVEITLYPSGGRITLDGCERCGTGEGIYLTQSWKPGLGTTEADAIAKLRNGISKLKRVKADD